MQLLKDDHRLNIFVVIGTTQGDPNSWVWYFNNLWYGNYVMDATFKKELD
jgi:hypothetical protein